MLRHRIVVAAAWVLTAAWLVVMVLLLRPYDDVSFPKGNVASVEPSTVAEGGTVTVTFPAYCNNGRTVTVDRYADVIVDGVLAATERLSTITFYPVHGAYCREPEVQSVPLPEAFRAYAGEPTEYRIRTVTAYRVPLRTIRVEASTDIFTVTP